MRSLATQSGTSAGATSGKNHSEGRKEVDQQREKRRRIPNDGITLSHFVNNQSSDLASASSSKGDLGQEEDHIDDDIGPVPISAPMHLYSETNDEFDDEDAFRMGRKMKMKRNKEKSPRILKFHLKTYGCQMNVSDSDIIRSILLKHGTGTTSTGTNETKSNTFQKETESNLSSSDNAGMDVNVRFEENSEETDAHVLLTNTYLKLQN